MRAFLVAALASLASLASLVACDKPFATPPISEAAGSGGAARPPSGATPPPGTGRGASCPSDEPLVESTCQLAAACVYGNDVENNCNLVYSCLGGEYRLAPVAACGGRCPKDFEEIVPGGGCGDVTMACSYVQGTCACMDDADGGAEIPDADAEPPRKGHWKCVPPPDSANCPFARPHPETECVKPVACDYGSCELSRPLAIQCSGLTWFETAAVCP